jgi:hypothetical protein
MHHVVQFLQQRKSNFGQVLVLETPALQVLQQSSEHQPGHKDPSRQRSKQDVTGMLKILWIHKTQIKD